jgi:hypothetical protein
MKIGLTLGAIVLASNVAFAQVAIDMATLERKVEDAQAAYDRNQGSADRQEMSDIRDELGYMRVKQRRGEAVTRTDRLRLSDRVDRFLGRMNGRASSSTGVYDRTNRDDRNGTNQSRGRLEIPSGSEVDVRLLTALTSDTAQIEDRVEATTLIDLYNGNDLLVPAGSTLTGWVTSVDRASRTDRKGSLTLEFNRLKVNNRSYDVRAYVTQGARERRHQGRNGPHRRGLRGGRHHWRHPRRREGCDRRHSHRRRRRHRGDRRQGRPSPGRHRSSCSL